MIHTTEADFEIAQNTWQGAGIDQVIAKGTLGARS